MKVKVRVTFFFGELKPTTLSLRSRYSSTFEMKLSASSLFPVKRGGLAPIALTFAAAAMGCRGCCATGGAPPPPPPPQMAMWSSVRRSVAERGWEDPVDAVACVVVCVWVVVVVTIFGSWVRVEVLGLFVVERMAGEFLIVLLSKAVLVDAVLDESVSESRS